METISAPKDSQVTLCPCCGMACRDEDLRMCLGCSSVYCGRGTCRVVCPCYDEESIPIPNRPAQELFTRIVHDNPFAVIIKDAAGRVIYATERDSVLRRTLGFSSEQLVGKTNFDLFRSAESTTLNRVELEVTSRLRPFRFVTNLTTCSGSVCRFMVEVASYRLTPGDHLTITTLTPASAPMITPTRGKSLDLDKLQRRRPSKCLHAKH
jgi:PAS domain S-box-containing protein